jgi:hypothetical protein
MNTEEKDALLEVLAHVFEFDEDIEGLVYLDIQKIFYYLKERLDEDNDIKDLLHYYWYIDGKVSDTVQEAVDYGVESNIIYVQPTYGGGGEWYEISEEFSPPGGAEYDEVNRGDLEIAKEEVENVLNQDYDLFCEHDEKIDEMYENAPYDFQRHFKLNILFSINLFAEGKAPLLGLDNLKSEISTVEAYLPLDSEFREFNEIFSQYVNISESYLGSVSSTDRRLADRFKQLSENIWRLYCQKLRLLEHDPHYESKLDNWEEEYMQTKSFVANDIIEFRRMLDREFDEEEDITKLPEDSMWGEIAADYLGESE